MEPANKQERMTAIKKFGGIYFLSLLFPLVASFFMFSKPGGALKDENERLREEIKAQQKLLSSVDSFNNQFLRLHELDKTIIQIGDDSSKILQLAEATRQSEEIEAGLKDATRNMKKDSTDFTSGINRDLTRNMLHSFESMLIYRNTIGALRQGLGPNSSLAKKLVDANEANRQLQKDIETLKAKSEDKGGGSNAGLQNELNVLNFANANLIKENQKLTNDFRALNGQLNSTVKELTDCKASAGKPGASVYSISSDDLKNISLIAEAESYIKLADPTLIISNDNQRVKNANNASGIIGILERSTNPDIRAKAKQQREQLNRVIQDIRKGVK